MELIKNGLIFVADAKNTWMHSHAMIPTPVLLSDDIIRVYATFCDAQGIGRPGYVDIFASRPHEVINYSQEPLLELGEAGTFDDNGIILCSVVSLSDGSLHMYYAGFELYQRIRYKLFTGLAIKKLNQTNFNRYSSVPILDRTSNEYCIRGGPYCIYDERKFKLWYVAGSDWLLSQGVTRPAYVIKYLESSDGVHWGAEGHVCIDIQSSDEFGFGRPMVIKRNGLYHMFYSIRNHNTGYQLGYAVSSCGLLWERKDELMTLACSEEGWDSQMLCYSSVLEVHDKTYLFYNGNDFGRTGFGYAELIW